MDVDKHNAARWERRLVVVLRITAVITGTALFAVLLPRPWMAAIHRRVGLGVFPEGAIIVYLSRSLSAFYALYGGLTWLVSTDVRR